MARIPLKISTAGGFSSLPLSLKHLVQWFFSLPSTCVCLKMPLLWLSEVWVGCLEKHTVSKRINHVKIMIMLPLGFHDRMVVLGYKKALTTKDLWALRDRDKAQTVMPKFMKQWDKERSV